VKQISPVAFFSVVLVVLVIVGAIAFSVWKAPSSTVDKTAIPARAPIPARAARQRQRISASGTNTTKLTLALQGAANL